MVSKMTAFYPASRLPKEIQLDYERYQNLSIQAIFGHFQKLWHEKRDSSDNCPFGTSVHNGLMKNSGFIGSYTLFSLAHLCFIQFLPIM